ncbi:MAG: methyltransferase [Myxococcota bacterium]|nr:methyltransferase [Myxococcota bacterium]
MDSAKDRLLEWRSRVLSSPRFLRWAERSPLIRWLARRRARQLFDLCAGFVYSQVLLACVRLRLFELLAEGPRTAAEIAERAALSPEAAERLLKAATSLRLFERRGGGRFGLGALGVAVIGKPAIAAMVEHHALLYADLGDPVALLRGEPRQGALASYWPYAAERAPKELEQDQVAAYSELMSASQSLIADQVLDAVPLEGHRCLLDVAGGEGAFLEAAGSRFPGLRLLLFDLPTVAGRARIRFEKAGLSGRATAVGGDLFSDPLPEGADVVSLIRVVHDFDDGRALELLRAVRRAIRDDGVLLLAEPMSGTAGAEPIADAYFAFYLLAMGSGRPRTPDELADLLRAGGFPNIQQVPTRLPLQTRLIVARPG